MSAMLTHVSNGVRVSVETFYQPEYSQPMNHEFMFAYRITIVNEVAMPRTVTVPDVIARAVAMETT